MALLILFQVFKVLDLIIFKVNLQGSKINVSGRITDVASTLVRVPINFRPIQLGITFLSAPLIKAIGFI